MLGLDDLWFKVGQPLRVREEKAKTFVQSYVDRRHQIVHRGDLGQTKRTKNRLARITRPYAEKCVKDMSRFVEAVEKVVSGTLERS